MKKKLITFLFLLVIQFSYTQVFYNKESNNLRYAGGMKPEVFEKITQEEKLYLMNVLVNAE